MINEMYVSNFPQPIIVQVNGVELEVFEAGKQNVGNPIVLCHGFPEHAFSWRYQVQSLVDAGYHVIIPNQRGYGNSSQPTEITQYDIIHLTGDLVALLDHFGYEDAVFVGHDWGANVVWHLALLHPKRVNKIINLALPYQERGEIPWLDLMEAIFGEDFYFVHFNRQIGVADDIMNKNTTRFLHNIFRKNVPLTPPEPGMLMINLAQKENSLGEPLMQESELSVFITAFEASGFTGSINWYRNMDRNWHIMADIIPIINHPTLMIYGLKDTIPENENLKNIAPNLDVIRLDCGHWIQQEKPEETTQAILQWLRQQND
ncbi:alpha/beta hydrolase [Myroides marinus]|uniref:Pimeloyl-ACP methyl ester carboxylesterase n=1 Tax=Myroides marinus TaxID=703342 RepID=A0A1H6X5X4_9FLAO|nr:alpha/beta hydrolase [Myroides marinus]MDM1390213.1 alpha/beta hydrolase [Myroides marinus]SEJ23466.1 Pimeloyl-ACP methyl ester carboxylesterase [Myroides marinus]